jgi:hypothetical protein
MATLSSLVTRLRLELGDPALPFQARVIGDGATDQFNLPVELVDPTGLLVSVDGVLQTLDVDFSVNYRAGVVTLEIPPADGDEVVVEGLHYETFLGEDLETFVETAFLQHTHGRTNSIGLPLTMEDLPGVEEYLVVILAQIESLWAMLVDAAQEIDVRSPDGVTIPVGQRYQQLLGLIAALRMKYDELAQALNVGLYRIEMFTLRRTSRTTNRLVPLYKAQEYDEINRGFSPHYGPEGTVVVIRGDRFTGATEVAFGGVAATEFEVISDEVLKATVPVGAQSGQITVTTPGGVATTHYRFEVGHGVPHVPIGAGAQRIIVPVDDGVV